MYLLAYLYRHQIPCPESEVWEDLLRENGRAEGGMVGKGEVKNHGEGSGDGFYDDDCAPVFDGFGDGYDLHIGIGYGDGSESGAQGRGAGDGEGEGSADGLTESISRAKGLLPCTY